MTAAPEPHSLSRTRGRARNVLVAALAAGEVVAVFAAGWGLARYTARASATADRQADVAAKGRQMMPFDLDRTTHVFADQPDGGTQTVVADDPSDTDQIRLIRGHLREEATRFARGDYSDPTSIHGEAMPGLGELKEGAERIRVRYEDLPDGARITYTTTDPSLVRALHTWFEAQSDDHGSHAEHTSS